MRKTSIYFLGSLIITTILLSGCTTTTSETPSEQAETKAEECIITVNDSKYNVTSFRSEHKGGDVFKCGEDMSEAFKNAHKDDFKRLEPFKI
ncbi:hypothetical protein KBD45_04055 [Candidatus Dojkabacteria bacterium]|nr:hypothetical protein [Candidatus Dojkabacteria bacterium]